MSAEIKLAILLGFLAIAVVVSGSIPSPHCWDCLTHNGGGK